MEGDAKERWLDEALARLPRHHAPPGLIRRLEQDYPPRRRLRWPWLAVPAAVVAVGTALFLFAARPSPTIVKEAVNDHLRVLAAAHPAEVETGGLHQVKPWLVSRLDFAPALAFGGDEELPLVGGAVGYFLDRKCAVYLFRRRLHAVTLLVVPVAGFDWPSRAASEERGFRVVLWRRGDLGYALVSDAEDIEAVAGKLEAN